jgi:phage-related protein (TIGR01555 family)
MARPVGSKNKPKQQTTLDATTGVIVSDGYAQAFSGAGTNRDRSTSNRIRFSYLLQEAELNELYIGDGFAKKIVDAPAEEMVRAGIDFEEMDEALETKIQNRYDELNVLKHAADAVRWSRLHGGSVWVVGLNDGGAFDVPFNPTGLKTVEFIRVYSRWQAIVIQKELDPMSLDFGKPVLWQIIPYNGGAPYMVHASRMRVFDGEALPDRLREQNLQWGASSLQSCTEQLKRFGMGHQWANMLLERAQQAVHGIPNLAQTLMSPGGEKMIQQRVDIVDMVRGTLNTVVIDAAETYDIKSPGVGPGVVDLLDRQAEALSGVSSIPVFILMEKSTSGLNGSSQSNERAWANKVSAWQEDILHDPLKWMTDMLIIEQGASAPDYQLCFNPIYIPTIQEAAATALVEAQKDKAEMETAAGYVAIGALDPNEVRDEISEEYNVSGKLKILEAPPTTAVSIRA